MGAFSAQSRMRRDLTQAYPRGLLLVDLCFEDGIVVVSDTDANFDAVCTLSRLSVQIHLFGQLLTHALRRSATMKT